MSDARRIPLESNGTKGSTEIFVLFICVFGSASDAELKVRPRNIFFFSDKCSRVDVEKLILRTSPAPYSIYARKKTAGIRAGIYSIRFI